MRPTVDLLDHRFTFTLRDCEPLTAAKFVAALRERNLDSTEEQLDALHRVGVLVPLLRVRRNASGLVAAVRREPEEAWYLSHWDAVRELRDAYAHGRVYDPANEGFIARSRLRRPLGERTYESSVYLYSRHQVLYVPLLQQVIQHLQFRVRRGEVVGVLPVEAGLRQIWLERAALLRDVILAVSALEPIYYPQVLGWSRFSSDEDADAYWPWRSKLPLGRMKHWLGINAGWLKDTAARLLAEAERIDPLGEWAELIGRGDPDKWTRLRGSARNAMDFRVAAEILLKYHDRLVAAGRAKPLPESQPRFGGAFDDRLKPRRPLDSLLTEFGLSPHPRLVVVVEGPTEGRIFPRAMETLGVELSRDTIWVEDAEGVDRDISSLLAYFAPALEEPREDRYAQFQRPPTRFLIVFDAEGKVATPALREERRKVWIDRIERAMPQRFQTPVVRDQLERFVYITTWKRSGESFEFAHFTDLQLATTIHALDARTRRKPTVETLRKAAANIRAKKGNLDTVLEPAGIGKPDFGDALWPTMERRLDESLERGTHSRIPIVRVVVRAWNLAYELPRKNLVIGLLPDPRQRHRRNSRV
jgi:hypothetical protein